MPKYIVTAYDAPNSLDKRLATREAHIKYIKELSDNGKAIIGGAMKDDQQNMIGSVLFFDMSAEELEEYKTKEPYIKAGVWADIKIHETSFGDFFIANIADKYNKQQIA